MAKTLNSTKATISDFRNHQLLLSIHTTQRQNRISSGTPNTISHSSPRPRAARSSAGRIERTLKKLRIGRGSMGEFQPPKNSVDRQRRKDEDAHVLGEEEEAEAHAAVLGGEAGNDLAVGLGQVERRAVALGGRGNEEDDERERLLEDVPVPEPARLVARRCAFRLSVPASMITPTGASSSGSS